MTWRACSLRTRERRPAGADGRASSRRAEPITMRRGSDRGFFWISHLGCRLRRPARRGGGIGASPRGGGACARGFGARGARAFGAAEARHRARRNLRLGAVVRRLYGRAAPGGALQGHRRRGHRRGRPLCLRREPRFAHLPVLADRGRAERKSGRLQMHEDLLGPARRRGARRAAQPSLPKRARSTRSTGSSRTTSISSPATRTRPSRDPSCRRPSSFYKAAGVEAGNLTLVERDGGHAFITEEGGAACGISAAPYVTDCDYDQARAILGWIYGPLAGRDA